MTKVFRIIREKIFASYSAPSEKLLYFSEKGLDNSGNYIIIMLYFIFEIDFSSEFHGKMTNGVGKKTEKAQHLIVRYIWDKKLKAGERLPSCSALARELDLSDTTVFRAIRQLQKEKILDSHDKVGVFVSDPRTPGLAGYTIGILAGGLLTGIQSNALSCNLQSRLANNGCRSILFHGDIGPDSAREDTLARHLGVTQCIRRGDLQALLLEVAISENNWKYLEKHKIPACYIGGFTYLAAPLSVTLDLKTIVTMGIRRLIALGKKRPALLLPKLDTVAVAKEVFAKETAGLPGFSADRFCWENSDYHTSAETVQRCLMLPESERPDGFLFLDDVFAQSFYAGLIRRNGIAYMPHPVVLRASEVLPFSLPLDVDYVEYSISGMADEGVRLILESLRTGKQRDTRWIQPNPIFTDNETYTTPKEAFQ